MLNSKYLNSYLSKAKRGWCSCPHPTSPLFLYPGKQLTAYKLTCCGSQQSAWSCWIWDLYCPAPHVVHCCYLVVWGSTPQPAADHVQTLPQSPPTLAPQLWNMGRWHHQTTCKASAKTAALDMCISKEGIRTTPRPLQRHVTGSSMHSPATTTYYLK